MDEEAVQVAHRIYSMALEGYGTEQIAAGLEQGGILTPRAYWPKKGVKRLCKGKEQPTAKWNSSTSCPGGVYKHKEGRSRQLRPICHRYFKLWHC